MKENVVPGICAINKDSGYSLIFNNLIRRVARKFYLLENSHFNVEKGPHFLQSVEARWCSGETMNGSTRLAKPTLPGLDYQTRCLEQFS